MAHRVLSPINDLWKTKNARKFPVAVVGLLLEASGSGKTDKTDSKQVVVVRRTRRTRRTRTGQGQYEPEPDKVRIVRFYRGFVSSGLYVNKFTC